MAEYINAKLDNFAIRKQKSQRLEYVGLNRFSRVLFLECQDINSKLESFRSISNKMQVFHNPVLIG